jgi:hypothetical protein
MILNYVEGGGVLLKMMNDGENERYLFSHLLLGTKKFKI